jgi:LPXTG-motif cell wall-anchored protein
MQRHRLALIVLLVVAVMALMAPALAGNGYQEPLPVDRPEVVDRTPRPPRPPEVDRAGEVLPITGSDLTLFLAAGALTAATGAALVRRARGGARL